MRTPRSRLLTTTAALAVMAGSALVAPAASAASTPACGNADLSASYRHSDDAAGHRFGWIVLTNTSGHACHTGGYGGVSYVGHGDGTQIGASAVRQDHAAVKTLVVKAGGRLRSPIDEARSGDFGKKRCRPTHVDGFRVYVPNATLSQFVPHPTTGCANGKVHLLFHKPYRRP
jgi:Protein of unknown function (DUF4232)